MSVAGPISKFMCHNILKKALFENEMPVPPFFLLYKVSIWRKKIILSVIKCFHTNYNLLS